MKETYCLDCWRRYKLKVYLRPISFHIVKEDYEHITTYYYVCSCGYFLNKENRSDIKKE